MHKTDIDEHCLEPMLCSEVTNLSLAAFTVPLDPQQTIENLPLQPVPPLFSVIPARDAFLLTMAVQSAYLSYHSPPVSSIQSSHAPLTFIISKTFPATELLDVFWDALETVMCENPTRSAISKILQPVFPAPGSMPLSDPLRSHFSFHSDVQRDPKAFNPPDWITGYYNGQVAAMVVYFYVTLYYYLHRSVCVHMLLSCSSCTIVLTSHSGCPASTAKSTGTWK